MREVLATLRTCEALPVALFRLFSAIAIDIPSWAKLYWTYHFRSLSPAYLLGTSDPFYPDEEWPGLGWGYRRKCSPVARHGEAG